MCRCATPKAFAAFHDIGVWQVADCPAHLVAGNINATNRLRHPVLGLEAEIAVKQEWSGAAFGQRYRFIGPAPERFVVRAVLAP